MHKVSVITVNYNHSYVTEALLDSILAKNSYPLTEIIVVDNGSKEDPLPGWKQKYPTVIFIRSEKNLGFAGGNNLGIKQASGDYFFLVNNDTEFTAHLIDTLVTTLDSDKKIGMVSPKIQYYDQPGVLQYAGFTKMNYYTARNRCIGQFEKDDGQYDHLTGETGFAHGAAMMVKREAVERAGMMAENFFLYYEEMDWCEHIKQAGYSIWINMQALIYHKESVSVGNQTALKEYFMNRNRILFIRRNVHDLKKIIFWLYFLFVVTPRNIVEYIQAKNPGFIPVLFKAIQWNFTNDTNSFNLGYSIKNQA